MLETFTLKEQLNTTRQELAQALYRQDAALRVIARLTKERDDARNQLAAAQAYLATARPTQEEGMEVEEKGISEQIKQKLIAASKKLTAERKQRRLASELATENDLKNYRVVSSHAVHSSSKPGILCVDIHPNQNLVLTGGVDKNVVLFDRSSQTIAATLTGHSKPVTDVLFHPEQQLLVSTSKDKTVRFWTPEQDRYAAAQTLRIHEGEVVGASLHPTGDYLASGSTDSSWAFVDIQAARALAHVRTDEPEAIQCISFHPDGMILGTGTVGSRVRVWDLKTTRNVAQFEGHTAPVTDICFSENGFYMASTADDNTVRLWDLRKLKVFQTFDFQEGSGGPARCSALAFDYSGSYLAVAGASMVRVYGFGVGGPAGTQLDPLTQLTDHTAAVTDVAFGAHARTLVSTSMDRSLKFYAF
eukprot:TRINITY_DN3941_c0_g1_i1.p1 TRINITY_DN3941_c0_g1~~TRINITY_DN3941_c0_g1_i1.p1  ORF type:complete len:417 (+),score=74.61 TRINITY_DN3941_c0_g1_i1:1008-2258(+)